MTSGQLAAGDALVADAAMQAIRLLGGRVQTVATAESLTGGLVGAALTGVPGASQVYRGGVIAYATDLKGQLLGVDAGLLARVGAVDERVAAAMAQGVRARLGADYGLATTGVAGPDPQDGKPPGTVWVAVATGWRTWTFDASMREPVGDRAGVRVHTVLRALRHLCDVLRDEREDPPTAHR